MNKIDVFLLHWLLVAFFGTLFAGAVWALAALFPMSLTDAAVVILSVAAILETASQAREMGP